MNRRYVERVTECQIRFLGEAGWGLFSADAETPLFVEKGRKEAKVFEALEKAFWKMRKAEVLKRDGYRCVACVSPFKLSVDHIINRSQGGTHNRGNLQTLCDRCHYAKTNLMGRWSKARV